jgi:hypothetical protein
MLIALCAFIKYRVIQSSPIGDNWTSITRQEYDEFRSSPYFDGTIFGSRYPKATSLRLEPLGGETSTPIIESRHGSNDSGIDSDNGETKEYHRIPVALTRTQDAAALKYVVVHVLNQPDDGPLMKSLANDAIDHVRDLT